MFACPLVLKDKKTHWIKKNTPTKPPIFSTSLSFRSLVDGSNQVVALVLLAPYLLWAFFPTFQTLLTWLKLPTSLKGLRVEVLARYMSLGN